MMADRPAQTPSMALGSTTPSLDAEQAEQTMLRDIDLILARLEDGVTIERAAMDGVLARLSSNAA